MRQWGDELSEAFERQWAVGGFEEDWAVLKAARQVCRTVLLGSDPTRTLWNWPLEKVTLFLHHMVQRRDGTIDGEQAETTSCATTASSSDTCR